MKKVIVHITFALVKFTAIYLPFTITCFEVSLRILLKNILKYRSSVIMNNLHNSFNRMESIEIKKIRNEYYTILARYFKEVIFIMTKDKSTLLKMVELNDNLAWKSYFNVQKSTIVTASHFGNWEMNMVLFPLMVEQRVVAFYKPISDQIMDDLMLNIRSKFGLELYPIEKTARILNEFKNENIIYLFIGDQSPLNMNGVYWNTFLNQETPWLNGSEKLAIKYNFPVLYLHQVPKEDAGKLRYELKLQIISNEPKEENKDTITQKYSEILEDEINSSPANWLWSHNRWKRAQMKS